MSNVAIKLIAVTGVVGLGVLMFLQAQKGIQSGNIENQMSQLDVLEPADSKSAGEQSEPSMPPEQTEPQAGEIVIPRDKVPTELSELAAKNATPIKSKSEVPFAPNATSASSKIKLTAATEKSALDHLDKNEFEPEDKNAFNAPAKGLDFRESPALKTPDFDENPFAESAQPAATEKQKEAMAAPLESDFKAGPQFGLDNNFENTPASDDTKTTIPPRESISNAPTPASPFEQETAPAKPTLSPTPELPMTSNTEPESQENPFSGNTSPATKLETDDSPFEIKEGSLPETPKVDSNPFMTVPKSEEAPEAKPLATSPAQLPAPKVEPEFNPFGNEPAAEQVEPAPVLELKLPESTPSNSAKSEEKQTNPFSKEPQTTAKDPSPAPLQTTLQPEETSSSESSDIVVIKKRKEPAPEEPPLFPIEGKTRAQNTSTPQPIQISPAAEPKPLNLVEGNQPVPQEPAKLTAQQKTQSPKMTIQKVAPPEAILGQPFIYHVLVKNSGTTSAQNVVVEDRIPKGAKLTGTIPRAEQIKDRIIWRLGEMSPGTEKKISIRVIPETAGQIGSVATVNFVTEVASETKITSPKLAIQSDQPGAVKPGEITVVNYTITNSGTGDANNVYIRSIIPPQFTHPGGDDLEYNVGIIPAGGSKQVQLKLKAIKPGAGKNISSVMGDGNLKAETEVPLKVIGNGEQFLLTRKGPKNRYLGRSGVYENTIANNTERPIQNISVFESVPPGMKFITASANGQFDTVRNVVQWDISELAASEQRVLTIELEPIEVGKLISTVQVVTDNNTKYSANLQSEVTVIGQPLLKVETSELKGPLEVGEKMAMQIQLVNQGSASATHVEFRVKIPNELVFLAAKGPVRYKQAGSYIIFEPAQELPAKQALNFELSFSAQNKGDARVLVSVQSKQMQKPLNQEEAIPVLEKLQ
ncbi:COG1361 family protein [Gimesia fumaroli]|uniref:Large cysteine-rich periplasmic protein OmcB n=1 Tax=Gimesia fumaroli TaxID=2527976 RepID=A0A518ID11_9PLAN|nr:DUF11 domain-containing protein [Gimesia fumaroli]QDV50993.1 Large cysteine-rich periplasmic protein OmcB precursor [Gimesia fumaroli]